MATFRRALAQGATYFFTVNTHQRQALLTEPPIYRALKETILSVMAKLLLNAGAIRVSRFDRAHGARYAC